jgi:hypothetical protein
MGLYRQATALRERPLKPCCEELVGSNIEAFRD